MRFERNNENVDTTQKPPVVISFCPGILGIERGIERVIGKLSVAAYVEIEAVIIANLVAGMEASILDTAPVWTDATTFNAQPFRNKVHGIIGGYPCPGESFAGLREGHLYKGFIWPYIRRAVSASKPLWCFFENVEGHLSGTYPIVYRSLRNMGYSVEAGLFSAEEIGASHTRKRTFILAVADTYLCDVRRRFGNSSKKGYPFEGKTREQNWQWLRNEFGNSNTKVADTCSTGLQGFQSRLEKRERQEFSGSASQRGKEAEIEMGDSTLTNQYNDRNISRQSKREVGGSGDQPYQYQRPSFTDFPLGQGNEQWEWEDPRTIEPKMGTSIDGYNFRGDLVRAIGNSVVEQTAELAWNELWKKMINSCCKY